MEKLDKNIDQSVPGRVHEQPDCGCADHGYDRRVEESQTVQPPGVKLLIEQEREQEGQEYTQGYCDDDIQERIPDNFDVKRVRKEGNVIPQASKLWHLDSLVLDKKAIPDYPRQRP